MALAMQLPALPEARAVFPNFVAQQSTTLILKEKIMSFSGDDFHIKDVNGTDVLRVEGKAMSLSGRKSMYDMQGNHLMDIRKEHLTFLAKFYAEDPQGNKFLEVNAKFGLGTRKFNIHFIDTATKQPVDLFMKGNFWKSEATITMGDVPVARIDRKMLSAKDWFGGKQTYALTVAPGFDMACAVAMCICLDEARSEGGGGGGGGGA